MQEKAFVVTWWVRKRCGVAVFIGFEFGFFFAVLFGARSKKKSYASKKYKSRRLRKQNRGVCACQWGSAVWFGGRELEQAGLSRRFVCTCRYYAASRDDVLASRQRSRVDMVAYFFLFRSWEQIADLRLEL